MDSVEFSTACAADDFEKEELETTTSQYMASESLGDNTRAASMEVTMTVEEVGRGDNLVVTGLIRADDGDNGADDGIDNDVDDGVDTNKRGGDDDDVTGVVIAGK